MRSPRIRGVDIQAALRTLAFLACTVVVTASVAAQVPQRDTRKPATPGGPVAPAPTGTGTLAGEVVADATGAKLRLAHVVLIGATTGVLKVTATDAAGKFSFTNLPVDRYTVGASKLPYLGAVAGARRPVRPGAPIALAEGARIDNVTIRLPMGAAISGVIYDEQGKPTPGVTVSLQQRKVQNGERVLTSVGANATTDDRGAYRVYGLAPGEYLVIAMPLRQNATVRALTDADVDSMLRGGAAPAAFPDEANMVFAPVYYPGTTRLNDAQPLLIATGDDRQNVDLRLERVRSVRIEGIVANGDGQPLQNANVQFGTTAGSSPLQVASSIRVGPDGRFGMTMGPGSYTLMARGGAGLFAFTTVEVSGVDVTGVQLTLQPPLSFAGRLTAAGTTTVPALAGHRIQVRSLSRASDGAAQVSATTPTGEFTVTGLVPGRYVIGNAPFFGASTASVTWGLESVMVDGKDVTDLPVTIAPEAMPKEVVVTLGDRWQELSGRVADAAGNGVSDYTVMVFPVNEEYWLSGSRRIVTAQPGTDGRFSLGGPGPALLPAGEYYLAAVTDVSKDEQYDPAFLQSLISSSVRITLAPGEKRTQNLAIR
ncbi:MAG TPA: carboxypeptidase regulatory-like domain-containing protein [Vicinamibacterales bacterium]|jgi:hypothetical protein|nr:carboxypeptidase regulatory-like domain-containing protein [Vicinamibacterales bacterium]